MSRFQLLSSEDLKKLSNSAENNNTKKSTQTWINCFEVWAKQRHVNVNLWEYIPSELNNVLSQFYAELRKQDGSEYEPDSLRVMQAAIHRFLIEKHYTKSILSDIEFSESNKILEGKARLLRQEGKGKRPNTCDALTSEDEEILWTEGKLGKGDPITLLHTLWFNNIQHFGLRGRQEHCDMTMDNFRTKFDEESGMRYIEFKENPTKTRQHGLHPNPRMTNPKMFAIGGDRCPVEIFDFFVSKRPADMKNSGRFYLYPKMHCTTTENWFKVSPVGKNKISKFMKEIISGTVIETNGRKLTNHSGRKTLVKKLKPAEVPESSIIKVTGHKTVRGLANYDPGDQTEFRHMSDSISKSNSKISQVRSVNDSTSSSSNVFNSCNVTINNNVMQCVRKKRKYVISSDSSQSQ